MRKSVFLELGGFSEIYKPYYSEDLDLCVRAWRAGWRSLFEPRSRVHHQHQGSIRKHEDRQHVRMIQRRNSFFFEWSHYPVWRLLCLRSVECLRQLLRRLIKGEPTYARALLQATRALGRVRRHRRAISEQCDVRTFAELIALLERNDA